jgi:hypothetical protein
MAGTAVFRIVVSSDSLKNATATSQGKSRLLEADGGGKKEGALVELAGGISFGPRNDPLQSRLAQTPVFGVCDPEGRFFNPNTTIRNSKFEI